MLILFRLQEYLYYMSGMVAHKIVNGKWVVMGNNSELELKMGI